MTDIVVTDAHSTVLYGNQTTQSVVTSDQQPKTIVTGIMGPRGVTTISGADDVDLAGVSSGSLLVYNPVTSRWVATIDLNQQHMDGGQF